MHNYINIGKIVATFGVKGEVILKHALGKKITFKGIEAVFVEQVKGSYLPFFVQSSKAKDTQETYLEIDTVASKEAAKPFIQKQVWLLEEDFVKLADKNAPIALLGYQIVNEGTPIGVVEKVFEQPHQVLLSITYNGNEALIPIHNDTLDSIDRKKKEVHVTLPDGLLEIYQ